MTDKPTAPLTLDDIADMLGKPHITLPKPITTPVRRLKLHPDDYSDDRPIFSVDRPSRAEQQESGRLNREAHDRYGGK